MTNVQFEEKRSTRKYNGAQSCVQGDKKPDAKWNKGNGDLSARLHPAKLPTCEKKGLKKGLSSEGNHQQHKDYANEIEKEGMCQSQQVTELGSPSHVGLALEQEYKAGVV